MGSRRVIQWACCLMILQGVISKFGAVFIIIPEPIVGGIFCVMFGMICAFGERKFILFIVNVSFEDKNILRSIPCICKRDKTDFVKKMLNLFKFK